MWFSVLLCVLFLFHTRLLGTRKCILYWYVNILQAPRKLDNIRVILLFSVSPNVWTSKSFTFKFVHLLYHFPRERTNKQRILSGTFEHDSAILCWTFLSRLCYRALILVHLAAFSCIPLHLYHLLNHSSSIYSEDSKGQKCTILLNLILPSETEAKKSTVNLILKTWPTVAW